MALAHDHGHAQDYREAIQAERRAKDAFFRTSPHSPLDPATRADFAGLRHFPVDPAYRFECLRLMPYVGDQPVEFALPTSDGRLREATRTGTLAFRIDGGRHTLVAYRLPGGRGDSLFVPFMDATSGHETYGAGRYLDLEAGRDGRYTLDFNLAYNPYCAWSPNFSCPLTPEENRLALSVEAGERFDAPTT